MGSALYACKRNVCVRAVFGPVRLVERTTDYRTRFCDRSQACRQSERHGNARDSWRLSGRHFHSERVFGYFHAVNPQAIKPAELLNEKRYLSLDLNYAHRVNSEMYEYLMDNGMTREEYHFFMEHSPKHHCIMGNDYYQTNEHRILPDGQTESSGEIFGYDEITRQYFRRYSLPVMHTETNLKQGPNGDEAVRWLQKEWASVLRLRNDGIPILGFTWYSITDQVDWDIALARE